LSLALEDLLDGGLEITTVERRQPGLGVSPTEEGRAGVIYISQVYFIGLVLVRARASLQVLEPFEQSLNELVREVDPVYDLVDDVDDVDPVTLAEQTTIEDLD
jgi:hypothetical protein